MKSKLLIPKIATYLIGGGIILSLLGFALSGFSPDRYVDYDHHWYNTVRFFK